MSVLLKFIRKNHTLAVIEQAIVKKKSRLSLNAFDIDELPHLLYDCMDVEHLYLHRNKITVIPVQFSDLINLTILTLDYNNISSLPPEIKLLKNLANLNISYNPLKVLIPEIGELENLEALWCNKTGLETLPKEIGNLSKLDSFGARGNKLKTLPDEFTQLSKLRWLTLENNNIESLPTAMDGLASLVHCNFRYNNLREFPLDVLKCTEIMFLQLNGNQISSLPDSFDTSCLTSLEMIDLRDNPICELEHIVHPLIRYTDSMSMPSADISEMSASGMAARSAVLMNPTALRLPPNPPRLRRDNEANIMDMEQDAISEASSEDWENSVNSEELDVQYQSDDDLVDNEALGLVLPDLSRYASTAS